MPKVTRIFESLNLNCGKYAQLEEQSKLLGKLRKEVWQRYGSINGVGIKHRIVRDQWVRTRDFAPLAAKAWKETLRDTLDDIHLYEAAAKEKVRKAIWRRTDDQKEQRRLFTLLKGNRWTKDSYLCRMMRKHKKHGRTRVANQIIVEDGVYKQFKGKDGNTWLKIPSLVRGKMICIPLNTKVSLSGALRLILKNGKVYVHMTIDQKKFKPCGELIVGVDKGYSEAFADCQGNFYGTDFGPLMTKETEKRHRRGIARNKLHQIAKKKPHKAANIHKFNLGRKKLDDANTRQKKQIRNIAFEAVHAIVDLAKEIRAENLSHSFAFDKPWKSYNRRMSAWARSALAEALESVSMARGSCLRLVNCAYTSQMDSKTHRLEGERVGDKFYHVNGDVSHAGTNAAVNIKHRADDTDIKLYTPFREVKKILLVRLTATGGVNEATRHRPSRTPVAHVKRRHQRRAKNSTPCENHVM